MSKQEPHLPEPGQRALEPDNIWSSRRLRRRARADRREKSQAAAEFGSRRTRRHQGLATMLLGGLVFMALAGVVVAYLLKKPAAVSVAASASAPQDQWRGSLPGETAEAFLAATTHQERMRWVRSPTLVEPLVAAFYATGPGSRETFSLRASLPLPPLGAELPAQEVARYGVLMADTSKRLLSIVATPDGARVDFHAYSRHTSAPWPDILEGRAASAEVRIFVSPGSYHVAPFENPAEWLPLLGGCPDVASDLLLYVRRGTPECAALEAAILKAPQRVTLTLAPVAESWRQRQFQVTAFHHEEWSGPPESPPAPK